MTPDHSKVLFVVGTPLYEKTRVSKEMIEVLTRASVIVGESRNLTSRFLRDVPDADKKAVFFLDNISALDRKELTRTLRALSNTGGVAALFSDTGMPVLFDPGADVLQECVALGFQVKCLPAPTSWGTAAALSGFAPPFLLLGFPPRKDTERKTAFASLATKPETLILMDTPYRFKVLLEEVGETFSRRQLFLAWEIGSEEEWYAWGDAATLSKEATKRGLKKGEFVLVVKGK